MRILPVSVLFLTLLWLPRCEAQRTKAKVCLHGEKVIVPIDDLQKYLDLGAKEGACGNPKGVLVCYQKGNRQKRVTKYKEAKHLRKGAIKGPCPCRSGTRRCANGEKVWRSPDLRCKYPSCDRDVTPSVTSSTTTTTTSATIAATTTGQSAPRVCRGPAFHFCLNGRVMARDPVTCRFSRCACPKIIKFCPNGAKRRSVPKLNCAYRDCPGGTSPIDPNEESGVNRETPNAPETEAPVATIAPVVTSSPTTAPVVTSSPTTAPVVTSSPTAAPVVTSSPTASPVVTAAPVVTSKTTTAPTTSPLATEAPVVSESVTEAPISYYPYPEGYTAHVCMENFGSSFPCVDPASFESQLQDDAVTMMTLCPGFFLELESYLEINSRKTIVCSGGECIIDGSKFAGDGIKAAAAIQASVTLCGVTFLNFENARDGRGSAVLEFGGTFTFGDIAYCYFRNNGSADQVVYGGAIQVGPGALLVTSHSEFEENSAASSGGAVSVDGGVAVFSNCSFIENRVTLDKAAAIAGGGALVAMNKASVSFTDSWFLENSVGEYQSIGFGGALLATQKASISITNCDMDTNSASGSGQHMFAEGDSRLDCFEENTFFAPYHGIVNGGEGTCR